MFIQNQYQTLFAYHFDLIRRLLEGAAQLSDADYHDNPGYGHGPVHDLLFHTLVTDLRWRAGLQTGERMPAPRVEDYPDLQALRNLYEAEKSAWLAYLAGLSEEDIAGDANVTASNGRVGSIPRWRILLHVALHGMQHSAELAEHLTQKGHSPGNIDFIFYE
jgi:uncharacterized damage-inducible protein DinB